MPGSPRTPATTAFVESDRLCLSCGYPLKGLRVGVPCPECGTPIRARHAATGGLMALRRDQLKRLAATCVSLSVAGYFAVGLTMFASVYREDPDSGPSWFQRRFDIGEQSTLVSVCLGFAAAAWIAWTVFAAKVCFSAIPAAGGGSSETAPRHVWRARLRWATVVSQWLWPVVALLTLWIASQEHTANSGGTASTLLGAGRLEIVRLATGLRCLAIIGTGLLAWQLSEFAGYANDTTLQNRFSVSAFALAGAWPIVLVLSVLAAATKNYVFVMVSAPFWICFMIGVGMFAFALPHLPRLALAAVSSQQVALERDRRQLEKARQEREAARQGKPSPFDTRRTLSVPTACVACGHELQGMKYGEPCPQCRHRIGDV